MSVGDQRRVVLRGKTPQYINATFVDVSMIMVLLGVREVFVS